MVRLFECLPVSLCGPAVAGFRSCPRESRRLAMVRRDATVRPESFPLRLALAGGWSSCRRFNRDSVRASMLAVPSRAAQRLRIHPGGRMTQDEVDQLKNEWLGWNARWFGCFGCRCRLLPRLRASSSPTPLTGPLDGFDTCSNRNHGQLTAARVQGRTEAYPVH
jgi:hypothetical protein